MSAADFSARTLEIVELAALRGRAAALRALAARREIALPEMGRATLTADQITLCVRPDRWLVAGGVDFAARAAPPMRQAAAPTLPAAVLALPAARRLRASEWHQFCEGVAIAIDFSSALVSFLVSATSLAPHCRLDLTCFPEGHAAATIIAQVSVILVRLKEELLLLAPATTARHFQEWLGEHIR